ncbi:MAG: hypothetical protein J6D47_07255 [Peptostreptococcaceae bacterium]|nr:hypothetical protein [Peptostreptococcaceae bacterium]
METIVNELLNKYEEINEQLKNSNITNNDRFILEVRASNIAKKLYRRYNVDVYNI